jgi:hypothetical protein
MDGESIATLALISALAAMNLVMMVISLLTYFKTVARQSMIHRAIGLAGYRLEVGQQRYDHDD